MKQLDEQEIIIARELIKNPRVSDNQISRTTGVPLKTVNNKRKRMEQKNILSYYTYVNNTQSGTGCFAAQQMYLIKLSKGISRVDFTTKYLPDRFRKVSSKHFLMTMIGESDGQVMLIMILESRVPEDLTEIFNAEIIPELKRMFSVDAPVDEVKVIPIRTTINLLHNYHPYHNIELGILKKDWPDEDIFVTDKVEEKAKRKR